MVIRIADERMCLSRAVNYEVDVLDMLVQRRRDGRAAPRSSGAARDNRSLRLPTAPPSRAG
jgi:hypothetical protein